MQSTGQIGGLVDGSMPCKPLAFSCLASFKASSFVGDSDNSVVNLAISGETGVRVCQNIHRSRNNHCVVSRFSLKLLNHTHYPAKRAKPAALTVEHFG